MDLWHLMVIVTYVIFVMVIVISFMVIVIYMCGVPYTWMNSKNRKKGYFAVCHTRQRAYLLSVLPYHSAKYIFCAQEPGVCLLLWYRQWAKVQFLSSALP